MSNQNSNWPNAAKPKATPAEIGELVATLDELRKLPPVSKSDPDGVRERLNYYFNYCSDYGIKPSVEGMTLALGGVSRQTLWNWENDEKSASGQLIRRAKQLINTLLTAWTMDGKINPVFSIWLQKQHYGYTDNKVLEIKTEPEHHSFDDLESQLAAAGLVWSEQRKEYIPIIDVADIKEVE